MMILLGDFSFKVSMEDILKPTIGKSIEYFGAFYDINNDNGDGVVKLATCNNLTVKSTLSPYRKIRKLS
jgi:hypothetical protein